MATEKGLLCGQRNTHDKDLFAGKIDFLCPMPRATHGKACHVLLAHDKASESRSDDARPRATFCTPPWFGAPKLKPHHKLHSAIHQEALLHDHYHDLQFRPVGKKVSSENIINTMKKIDKPTSKFIFSSKRLMNYRNTTIFMLVCREYAIGNSNSRPHVSWRHWPLNHTLTCKQTTDIILIY